MRLKDLKTGRLTPFARSLVAVALVLAAALYYFFAVGIWVADAETRSKFQVIERGQVISVEVKTRKGVAVVQASASGSGALRVLDALKSAKTRLGFNSPPDAEKGYIRVSLDAGQERRQVTVFYPLDRLADRFGKDVDEAVRTME
ncbi:MAG: hypothetical protein JSS65_09685 [Armatimonadetes bacterium]|nr:hypothetical protein [Armatimonadota bacterium]